MARLVVYLVVRGLLFLSFAQLAVVGGMRLISAGDYSDPFAPYEAMMPGQPAQIPATCSPHLIYGASALEAICFTDCDECAIGSAIAAIYEGRIRDVWFYADKLYVGDVVQHWGWPDRIVKDYLYYYLLWDNGMRIVIDPVTPVGRFNYLKIVERVLVFREAAASSA